MFPLYIRYVALRPLLSSLSTSLYTWKNILFSNTKIKQKHFFLNRTLFVFFPALSFAHVVVSCNQAFQAKCFYSRPHYQINKWTRFERIARMNNKYSHDCFFSLCVWFVCILYQKANTRRIVDVNITIFILFFALPTTYIGCHIVFWQWLQLTVSLLCTTHDTIIKKKIDLFHCELGKQF